MNETVYCLKPWRHFINEMLPCVKVLPRCIQEMRRFLKYLVVKDKSIGAKCVAFPAGAVAFQRDVVAFQCKVVASCRILGFRRGGRSMFVAFRRLMVAAGKEKGVQMETLKKRRFTVWEDMIPAFRVPPRPADMLATAMNEVHRWRFWHGTGWVTAAMVLLPSGLLVLFLWSGSLLRLADPAAGVLDAGIISVLLLALLAGCSIALLAWLLLRLLRDTLTGGCQWDEQTDGFTKKIRPCLEAKLCTAAYLGLLLLFGWLFVGLL